MNHQTLRYYERRGLLSEPDRTPGGHRLHPCDDLVTCAHAPSCPIPFAAPAEDAGCGSCRPARAASNIGMGAPRRRLSA
ncbi:MerR family DNA-binding transcriptional regulator [Actinosynnema sp. CA-299493]